VRVEGPFVPASSETGPIYYVYILRCSDRSLYVGHTRDVRSRVEVHNAGAGAAFTCKRCPVTVVYTEPHETKLAAIRRERQLKGWTRRKKEALIGRDIATLRALSKPSRPQRADP
jgi:putative endonuclease